MKTEQIYAAVDDLIALLKGDEHQKLAAILEHRMYQVSWTSSSELLDNVLITLEEYIAEHESMVDKQVVKKMREVVDIIKPRSSI